MTEQTPVVKMDQPPEPLPADPMVSMIERVVMDPNADLSKLEKMLEMKERIEEREARRQFDIAMAEAKAEIPPILKTGTVDYENDAGRRTYFKHETLDGIAKVIDPILSDKGLSYRYRTRQENGNLVVTCIIAHRGGYSEETSLQGGPDSGAGKNNYQALGSAATYLQRYTLKLALGLSAEKDTDGNPPAGSNSVSEEQFRELEDLISRTDTDLSKFFLAYGITAPDAILEDFPASKFAAAKNQLERKKAQMEAK